MVSTRSEIELIQPYPKHKGFTHTASSDVAEDAVTITGSMSEGNKVAFVVDTYDCYVEFDGDATTSSMYLKADTGYYDDKIVITTNISILNANAGQNARIRGIIWGR